jgi:hypothetical protein
MTFQITLTEHHDDGTAVPLLLGETHADMPTLLFAYNLELLLHGALVDATRFRWEDAAGDKLARVFAGLTASRFEKLTPGAQLRFRIEQQGDFLLETRPHQDPRPLLADVLAGSRTSGLAELDLLACLLWDAPVEEASSYAAACGWGIRSIVPSRPIVERVAEDKVVRGRRLSEAYRSLWTISPSV